MDPAVVILLLGAFLLACGSLALLLVRAASPKLRGTAWLSASFAAGSAAAALLLVRTPRLLHVFGADLSLLLSFVLLHVAVLRLFQRPAGKVWYSALLLGAQFVMDLLRVSGHARPRDRVICISFLVAIQTATTASLLWRLAKRHNIRAAGIFSSVLLVAFSLFNLCRAIVDIVVHSRPVLDELALMAFSLYMAVAIGVAFGFFWMTTAALTGELEHIASTDHLTRLYNRRVFLRWCEKELLRSHRSGAPFSLLMIDLDHFKFVNDSFGHQTGDHVLCAAVERMQNSVRGIDVLCRWGGEEFAVLLPNATAESTRIVAERIRENIEGEPFCSTGGEFSTSFHVTVSIGAATYRGFEDALTAMFHRADKALYEAKNRGRNLVLVAS